MITKGIFQKAYWALMFLVIGFCSPLAAQQSAPRLFFTDLESGPNTGGEQNLGAFITIYGEGFGVSRGNSTVTIGGREVARYVIWGQNNASRGLDMIVVQPGSNTVTGDIVIAVNGATSNPLPFTIRSGNIFFVATSGSDANPGSLIQPWRSIVKAKDTIAAGDIAYIRDGVIATSEENYGAAMSIETGGTQGAPKALVAYPGATATIGSNDLEFGMRVPNNPGTFANDWVFAKLVLRGQIEAVEIGGDGSRRWRVVGNNISCPVGDGQTGCFTASLAGDIAFLGNEVQGVSKQGPQPSKQYHSVYFSTDTNHVEVGWNHIHDNATCRSLQFHSSPLNSNTGYNQYDLNVHDNLIHGDVCDGIVFATVDPSKGPVRAFNNVIYDVGRGPSPPDGDANYSGIYVAGGTNTGADGTGTVEIFNNTLYDCGARKSLPGALGDEGVFSRGPGSPGLFMSLKNNIVYTVGGEDYIAPSSDTTLIRGNNNLWFGSGAAPSFLSSNIVADPKFVDLVSRDFRLQASSPAIDAGINTAIGTDYMGASRPQGASYDIGAHEYFRGTVVSLPGKATPVSPSAAISSLKPTYVWNAVSNATSYLLWVNSGSSSPLILTWFTASEAGCSSGTGTCSATPATSLASGAGAWWIQTRNSAGDGPWSDAMTFSVSSGGPPAAATLVSPGGAITTPTPAFVWNAVSDATWYYLWVNSGGSSPLIAIWYTAAQAGCSSGTGRCSVTPAAVLAAGEGAWWIQTWNPAGYGPWSSALAFGVSSGGPPAAAILVSPSGATATATPTFIWKAVANATWYYLWVNNGGPSGAIRQWFTSAQTGCAAGTGLCSVTPTQTLAPGASAWWIQTWNSSGYGPWSSEMPFTVTAGN